MSGETSSKLSPIWARWYRRALPTYWIFLFCLTHLPKLSLGTRVPENTDKLAHFVAFALLAFVYWRFNESFARPVSARFVWAAALLLSAYAALDEYLQQYVNRTPSINDWLANVAGIVTVLATFEIRRRRSQTSDQPSGPPLESDAS